MAVLYRFSLLIALGTLFGTLCPAMDAEFIQDSRDKLEKALINTPVQEGIAVKTIEGEQLTPANAMPSEIISNTEIFNDIARLRELHQKLKELIIRLGVRYDCAGDLEVINAQIQIYIQQIENEIKTKLIQ